MHFRESVNLSAFHQMHPSGWRRCITNRPHMHCAIAHEIDRKPEFYNDQAVSLTEFEYKENKETSNVHTL